MTGAPPPLVPPVGVPRLIRKVRREARWIRSDGVGRFIEEHRLHPLHRSSTALRKRQWRRSAGVAPGAAVPVFLVGQQRSGTNMLLRGFDALPEFEIHNESERTAFHYNVLRPDPVIRDIVLRSRHRFVLFKPLADSHRTAELLDGLGVPAAPKAIWVYRDVDGRARSAVAKFGPAALRVMREVGAGRADHLWHSQGLSADSLRLLRGLDLDQLTPTDGASLFWYVRNRLFFELGLHERDDVMLVSYPAIVRAPVVSMQAVCGFLGVRFSRALVSDIDGRAVDAARRLDLDPDIRAHCDALADELDAAAAASAARYGRASALLPAEPA